MPEKQQKYFGLKDVFEELARLETVHSDDVRLEYCETFLRKVMQYIRVAESCIDFNKDNNIDTPSKTFHRLEVLRAYRERLEKIICREKETRSPIHLATGVASTGESE